MLAFLNSTFCRSKYLPSTKNVEQKQQSTKGPIPFQKDTSAELLHLTVSSNFGKLESAK
jgi:hypothetical protein